MKFTPSYIAILAMMQLTICDAGTEKTLMPTENIDRATPAPTPEPTPAPTPEPSTEPTPERPKGPPADLPADLLADLPVDLLADPRAGPHAGLRKDLPMSPRRDRHQRLVRKGQLCPQLRMHREVMAPLKIIMNIILMMGIGKLDSKKLWS
eukprot:CAMPEP_0196177554 /NCGR_PEP_ID=MMETSP0911-20130528/13076_1 /TAXON_ID=49265 /ORGANISM="Thalassiosira rotula, Strain GSO102" /LENGTH=150 /DNA_ID=CAMNT_0041445665 /DNA_START=93 /DNA_END=546 /DNA_ORIENTATION=+